MNHNELQFSAAGLAEVDRLGSRELVEVAAISPEIARLLVNVALGDVLGRPDLDTRTRELLAVGMLAAIGADGDFVAVHARAALAAGASAAEVTEVIGQVITFAGFPRALAALLAVGESVHASSTLPAPRAARTTVLAFFEALGAAKVDGAMAFVAPDAIWSIPGDPMRLPWAGEHRGREAIAAFYATLSAHAEADDLRLGEAIAHGEMVQVRGEFAYSFPGSGGHYAGVFVIVFTVRDGLIDRYEMHEDSLGLVEAFENVT